MFLFGGQLIWQLTDHVESTRQLLESLIGDRKKIIEAVRLLMQERLSQFKELLLGKRVDWNQGESTKRSVADTVEAIAIAHKSKAWLRQLKGYK